MHKSTFDEEQLEKMLQNMPKVKDRQDPEQLFAKISSRLEEEKVVEKKIENPKPFSKKKPWILPTLASIAAVAILALVVPSFLYEQESTMDDPAMQSQEEKVMEGALQENAENSTVMAKEGPMLRFAPASQTHTITGILDEQEVITVAIPDRNAQFVVPVSFIVPKDGTTTKLERLKTIDDHLHEEEWGLANYVLENVELSGENNGKTLTIDVPADHPYGNGTAMEVIFMATVKEIAKQLGYSVVEFRTEGKQGIVLGNYGELTELDLQREQSKGIYFVFQPTGQGQSFLVPLQMDVDFGEAIESMKLPNELDQQQIIPSIPGTITINNAVIENNLAIIEFTEGTNLTNDENSLLMIEAILMTAKEYGAQSVEFKNVMSDVIGPFNLKKSVQVPLGVNPKPY